MSALPSGRAAPANPDPAQDSACNVLVVDDSAVLRRMLTNSLEADPGIKVVGTASDGEKAVEAAGSLDVDVVVLDVEMPNMDGLTALPKIRRAAPGAQVLMASKLTLRNAEISVKALAAGAADYLAKPSSTGDGLTLAEFNRELLTKVKALGGAAKSSRARRQALRSRIAPVADPKPEPSVRGRAPVTAGRPPAPRAKQPAVAPSDSAIKLRSTPLAFRPKILAVGCSTGGPQALMRFLTDLSAFNITVPIIVTQHMPPMFTKILSQQITSKCGIEADEAVDGQRLEPGRAYIAPGGKHMLIKPADGGLIVALDDGPPVHFCKPAVDPMFESIVKAVGAKSVLAIILTGMGHDGRDGSRTIVDQGGALIAQDEDSSVVWGMPGAVAAAGLCHSVLSIDAIAGEVAKFASLGSRSTGNRRSMA